VPGDIDFFGWTPTNAFARRFAADGMLSEDHGNLVVEVAGETVGDVSWFAVHHGPPPHGRALNIGIALLAEHRGKGYGTHAQRLLVDHLFATTRVERLEASTDVTNLAEQRALTKAGFTREGVLRHSQWRAGAFHDNVLFSRLRGD
jgi:RimJ/RimL family protein N-acetyltransferase